LTLADSSEALDKMVACLLQSLGGGRLHILVDNKTAAVFDIEVKISSVGRHVSLSFRFPKYIRTKRFSSRAVMP